jgi:DNA-binding HxlR family transcriptional regulator
MSSSYLRVRFSGAILELVMKAPAPTPQLCHRFHRASELIGRRWTGAIIYVLLRARCRFATLRDAIPDITDRMLSDRLQELEAEGIVERTVIPETPVRVEYALTKKGRALASAIDAISAWADTWGDAVPPGARPARASGAASPARRKA